MKGHKCVTTSKITHQWATMFPVDKRICVKASGASRPTSNSQTARNNRNKSAGRPNTNRLIYIHLYTFVEIFSIALIIVLRSQIQIPDREIQIQVQKLSNYPIGCASDTSIDNDELYNVVDELYISDDFYQIYTTDLIPTPVLLFKILMDYKEIIVLLDTGASTSVISNSIALNPEKLNIPVKFQVLILTC